MQVFIYKDLNSGCILGQFAESNSEFVSKVFKSGIKYELITEINADMTDRLNKLCDKWNIDFEDLLKRFFITDHSLRTNIDLLGVKYNGQIPESELNPFKLTPRHIDVTFGGKYMAYCGR